MKLIYDSNIIELPLNSRGFFSSPPVILYWFFCIQISIIVFPHKSDVCICMNRNMFWFIRGQTHFSTFDTRPARFIKTTPVWKQGNILHICVKSIALIFVIIISSLLWILLFLIANCVFFFCIAYKFENRPQNLRNRIRVLKI